MKLWGPYFVCVNLSGSVSRQFSDLLSQHVCYSLNRRTYWVGDDVYSLMSWQSKRSFIRSLRLEKRFHDHQLFLFIITQYKVLRGWVRLLYVFAADSLCGFPGQQLVPRTNTRLVCQWRHLDSVAFWAVSGVGWGTKALQVCIRLVLLWLNGSW